MKTALLFILMMVVLIAPHEFGHFIVAKLCNVQVNEFSVGMGPLLFKKRKGETQYSLRLIPIGGYCAMEGESDASDNPRAFNNKNPLQRIAILLAGVTMNVVIAIIVCTIAVQLSGVPINMMADVQKESPAAVAGIEVGDKIVSVDGIKTSSWTDVTTEISQYDKKGEMELVVNREGTEKTVYLTPNWDEERQGYTIGIKATLSKSPVYAVPYGANLTWELNKTMIKSFAELFRGKISKDEISGPVGLVKIVNQTSSAGIAPYLMLLALVSLNLAIINLIPIPGLDGGKLLFVILKVITRGKINDNMEYKASIIGFVLLMGLFIFITVNDVMNIFG